ncbi:MAG TPA: Asp-tRNA(Asn)/Glu-tRNA(Gln) amidotransferase GatCAB subunit B [Verrucomicrobia bacterium]|nr:MAG: glutaminyl-tRNA synthase (glutamine-hydrolyzing) subunit B [Lentisphaerae bacterium GWF2_57_35]HBA85512.1 Asp-tRNA(Asn)/Glu-tRNA(Gln) amidotransferase GatCAB subunit B [Verrucomicrobiota bacterium]
MSPSNYRATVGLEVHVQLKTRTKMFCGCPTEFGELPNTNVCPVCLGYPGAMPVMNAEAIRLCVRTGLMIGCRINPYSKFDRKNYFYPDMPKNFQISQYDQPLCLGGEVEIEVDGRKKIIHVTRIHQEEDVGKNMHFESSSGIDFNRAGTPLMELVTEPEIESADEAFAFLLALKQILVYGNISDCNLEEGNLRCDVNCSVRPEGQKELGVKTELKNMNTFKGVHRALSYEIKRQIDVVSKGGTIRQETRRWDDAAGVTLAMRSKEYAHDYRYFPEPDLMPVVLPTAQIEEWRQQLPELPAARRARLIRDLGLPEYDAEVLVADKAVADYFEETARLCGNAKAASNWIMTEMLRALTEKGLAIGAVKIQPVALAGLIKLVEAKTINMPSAKEVFNILFEQGGDPESIVKAKGMVQVSDSGALETFADQAIAANEKVVADYKAGKKVALQFLVGQVMKLSKGKANPQVVMQILEKKLQ